ncbi:M20/M25/M40 family metallo-hydrolase [Acidaminobacter sp. JC074]|uniref:M20/M25/M40 family metallo-hydrolase n=1 Tax=Acidaminobacter sp. JC074 TaxID=2530199 RepID=UPI001F106414|nr:M20/M25/M40 family metallo-hydrolase [Acidaminobacter sp. JC074]MCH4887078.1 M20/M25/M40 family metallo-hydrolase [Acidaminobacter sp. JC074]
MINEKRLIDEFMNYVTIDSESLNEGNFEKYIVSQLLDLDFEIIPDDTGSKIGSNGNNIIARRKGTLAGDMIGFCAHLDTVSPGIGIKPILKDGIITSSGDTILGADDKAGIAIILEIIRSAIENELELGPIEIFFAISEEKGIQGSKYVDPNTIKAKNYYILDGTGHPGEIITKGPGANTINITVKGTPAHAGLCPEKGISAIEVISEAISKMKLGRISEITTANVGVIQGGSATNIVCPEVQIKAEVRSRSKEELQAQTDHICDAVKAACDRRKAEALIKVDSVYESFEIHEDNAFLKYTEKVINDMNLPLSVIATGGGSDANNLSKHDIAPIILGIGIKDCHTTEESITTKILKESAEMCYNFIKNYWD